MLGSKIMNGINC